MMGNERWCEPFSACCYDAAALRLAKKWVQKGLKFAVALFVSASFARAFFIGVLFMSAILVSSCVTVDDSTLPQADASEAVADKQREKSDSPVLVGSYLSGQQAIRDGDLRLASEFLSRTIKSDPSDKDLLRQLFRVELSLGRMDRARRLARIGEGENRRPDSENYLDDGAAILLNFIDALDQEDKERARMVVASLSKHELSRIIHPVMEAWLAGWEGDWDKAVALISVPKARSSPIYYRQAALINSLANHEEDAARLYALVANPSYRLSPRSVRLAMNFFSRRGDIEAINNLRARWERENSVAPYRLGLSFSLPSLVEGPPPPLVRTARQGFAEALLEVAESFGRARVFEPALKYIWMALALDPGHVDGLELGARFLLILERYDEAIELWRKLAKTPRMRPVAQLNIARALEVAGRKEEARQFLEALKTEESERSDVLIALADLLRSDERFAEAAAIYTKAIDSLDMPDRNDWRLFYHRGVSRERAGNWNEAERDFLMALRLFPEQPQVLNYLGYSWVDKGQNLERAHKMIESAVRQSPNDGYIVDSLGWAFYRAGAYEDATRHLERAVELLPHDATINDHLGDAFWRVGRRNEARFQWERALNLDPEPELLASIRDKLANGLPKVEKATVRAANSK